jgi:hypothetical protein
MRRNHMQDYENLRKRKEDLLSRVSNPTPAFSSCRESGCPNPTTAGTNKGLNRLYCRQHEDHFERHGSYFKRSYTASEINPYRRAALKWINQNEDKFFVSLAILKVQALYQHSGQHIAAFRLRGLKPEERAKVAWARLREKAVNPRVPLSVWLAVEMIILDDPEPVRKNEFKWVQAAKIIHRQASGTHKRWEHESADGRVWIEEMHKYPISRGLVLRHIGRQLEKTAELVVDKHLDEIREFKKKLMK